MAAGGRQKRRLMGEINVVPYIDVMLVLLIIFMVTAPLLTQGIEVNLPKVGGEPVEQTDPDESLIMTVDRDGRFYLNKLVENPKEPLESEAIVNLVAPVLSRSPDLKVLVEADADVAYGHVALAMRLLQDAGAPSVGMITDPEELPRPARE
jgi:biopolymer transport protein TolR